MKKYFISMIVVSIVAIAPGRLVADEAPPGPSDDTSNDISATIPIGPIFVISYGLVTVAVGAGFGWQAYQENEDFNRKVDDDYPLATHALADDIKLHSITGDILMFGGAAVVLGGILWWVLDDDYSANKNKKRRSEALLWRPSIGLSHAGVMAKF